MFKIHVTFILIVSGLLNACGSGSDIPEVNTPVNPNTTINTVSIVGTSAAINNIIPINSGMNGGAFSIFWDVDSSDPYHVDLYLSEDNTFGDDVTFFSQNCGSSTLIYNCSATASFECRFTSSNKISCGTISAINTEKDITLFLDTLPKQAFLIIEACNALMDNCKTTSVAVALQ